MMKSFLIALQFMSRIHLARQTIWTNADFGGAVKFFPLVGLIIGLCLCAVYEIVAWRLSGLYLAIILVAAEFYLTGGLHADGYMDTADGIFSGRDRERMLEIMKDSRVGANGVMAFVFLVLLKICFLANIGAAYMPLALAGAPAASRFGTLISIFEFPYARKEGLGRAYVEYAPPHTLACGFVLALLPGLYFGFLYLVMLGLAMAVSILANTFIQGKIGGVTGDTYGAVIEFSEMVLFGAALFFM